MSTPWTPPEPLDQSVARLIADRDALLKALEDLLIYMGLNGDDHCPQFDAGVAAVKKARHG